MNRKAKGRKGLERTETRSDRNKIDNKIKVGLMENADFIKYLSTDSVSTENINFIMAVHVWVLFAKI